MKQVLSILTFCLALQMHAQNVGIGTSSPQAKLHLKVTDGNITALNEGFNEGNINPSYQIGEKDWVISSSNPYSGLYSAKAPSNFKTGETAILNLPVNVPNEAFVKLSFVYRHENQNNEILYQVITPEDTHTLTSRSSWSLRQFFFQATSSTPYVQIRLLAQKDGVDMQTFIDEIEIIYVDGPVLRIDDGSQQNGAILQSDADGNASWVDLRTEIDQDITSAYQMISFDESDKRIKLQNGGEAMVSSLTNSNQHFITLSQDSLLTSADLEFKIPSSATDKSHFHYSGNRGSFAWGIAPESNSYIDARNSVRWGKSNKVYAEFGSIWGYDNIIGFTGLYATTFGNQNRVFGKSTTAWGSNNEIDADSLATSWGYSNTNHGINATVWGQDNFANATLATTWGRENLVINENTTAWGYENVASGLHSTVWGRSNLAEGEVSTALGFQNESKGFASLSVGHGTVTYSFAEIAVGRYNYSNPFGNADSWQANEQLFSVGIGTSSNKLNAMTILKSGSVGIGTSATQPYYPLEIVQDQEDPLYVRIRNGDGDAGLIIDSDNRAKSILRLMETTVGGNYGDLIYDGNRDQLVFEVPSNREAIIIDDGGVGIKELYPSYDLHLKNNSAAKPSSSSWIVASDRQLKKEIRPFEGGLDLVKKINPVWFTYNGRASLPQETSVGTIAQELERVAPFMVTEWEREGEKFKAVDYGAMDFILVNAIKEQQEQIDTLAKLVLEQSNIIEQLRETIEN